MAARVNQISSPVVFISHSHSDREEAFRLHLLLKANGATTFLDQDEILAGDTLPQAIQNGIARCDKFLLVWSEAAVESEWVEKELEAAFELRKRIIPYTLDSSVLPDALQNFVYVNRDDEEHGHAELLRAVFGRLLEKPAGIDIFSGHWIATAYQGGTGNQVIFRLELRPNGQVRGESQAQKAGGLGLAIDILRLSPYGHLGLTDLFLQRIPLRGTWAYTSGGGLRLKLVQKAMGQVFPTEVTVHTSSKKSGALHGHDKDGNMWSLRPDESPEEDEEDIDNEEADDDDMDADQDDDEEE